MEFRHGILARGERNEFDKWSVRNSPVGIGAPGLSEFLSSLLRADDIETVWALTCTHMNALGFGGVIYGYSPTSTDHRIGEPEELLVLSTLDRRAMNVFVQKGLFWQSLTFNWALRNTGIASWSMSAQEAGMPESFCVSEDAQAFFEKVGLTAGCTIGVPKLRRRGRAVMGLLGQRDDNQQDVDERCAMLGDDLFVAATYAHRSLAELPFAANNRRLTRRQREVLEWIAEGKSVAEIGCILSISNATVEKHLRLARETLDADSTAHAVIKAAFLNQLFIGEL
ncbi:MAG: autoinducer binding domain-containing protein [Pararhodobacter sp.]|nr:autoinducer binding domain-containing protein [Pararhodobacter sp.]